MVLGIKSKWWSQNSYKFVLRSVGDKILYSLSGNFSNVFVFFLSSKNVREVINCHWGESSAWPHRGMCIPTINNLLLYVIIIKLHGPKCTCSFER